jgi:5,10-methylenetetrahydrofolate reductase
MSIVEKLDKIDIKVEGPKFSFEFFPPKTQQVMNYIKFCKFTNFI